MNTISIQKHNVSYNKNRKTFSCEISDLGRNFDIGKNFIRLVNDKTKNFSTFNFDKTEYYGSGEDREIGGWWYKSNDGYKLLIIND